MGIKISNADNLLLGTSNNDSKNRVDFFNNAVVQGLERYLAQKSGSLTSVDKVIFNDLNNEENIKYLAGFVNDKLVLISIHPTLEGCPDLKLYEITFGNTSVAATGTQLPIANIATTTIRGLEVRAKMMLESPQKDKLEEEIAKIIETSQILVDRNTPPTSPRVENTKPRIS